MMVYLCNTRLDPDLPTNGFAVGDRIWDMKFMAKEFEYVYTIINRNMPDFNPVDDVFVTGEAHDDPELESVLSRLKSYADSDR